MDFSGLLAAGLEIQIQPNDIASVRNVNLAITTPLCRPEDRFASPCEYFCGSRRPGDPLVRLGSYCISRGQVNKALAVTEEARQHEDGLSSYYGKETRLLIALNLASLYQAKQDLDRAKKEGLRAVSLDPQSPFALGTLGGIQILRREYGEARQTFENLTKLHPAEPSGWDGLSAALLGLGDRAAAREATQRSAREFGKSNQTVAPFLVLSQFRTPILFGATVLMLVALALSLRTIWQALPLLRRLPKPGAAASER